ncbi:MAG TPA: isochorismatase family protein [Acetobacteraceae bacterium]|nr:isochorismatase family protein [Acetobacteraceae bacterium]
MSDDYQTIGFGSGRIGFGARPGIAVVDFQTGFTEAKYPLGGRPMVERAVGNTAVLLNAARAARIPVVSCYTAYHSEQDAPHWKIPAVLREFRHGHPCTALDPRIYDAAYDVVLCKSGPSIFFQTAAITCFVRQRVDTIIIAGCNTSGCIRASVIDAFSYGFRTIVPEPCVGDVEEGPHRDNLRDMGRRYADIVTLEETLAYIEDTRRRNAP